MTQYPIRIGYFQTFQYVTGRPGERLRKAFSSKEWNILQYELYVSLSHKNHPEHTVHVPLTNVPFLVVYKEGVDHERQEQLPAEVVSEQAEPEQAESEETKAEEVTEHFARKRARG